MTEAATHTGSAPRLDRDWPQTSAEAPPACAPIRVLFATDGSPHADEARQLLRALPLPAGSEVEVLTVLDALPWQVPQSLIGAEHEWARHVTHATSSDLSREGVTMREAMVRGEPAHEILQAAESFRADLVVVGPTGRGGLSEFLLGSVAHNVAKHASCPVLIARMPMHQLQRVVLAVDESARSQETIRFAARLPLPESTEIIVCHVIRPYQYPGPSEYVPSMLEMLQDAWKEQRADAEQLVKQACTFLEAAGRHASSVMREGDPAREIMELARERDADLILAGARGISQIRSLLVGSVADRFLKSAQVSLLLVH